MKGLSEANVIEAAETEALVQKILKREDLRKTLSDLRAVIKDKERRADLQKRFDSLDAVRPLLFDEDAKVRKNAAALLGDLQIREAAPDLYLAYQKEGTLFVRGAVLGALEKTDPYPYLGALKERYDLLCAKETAEDEKKHIREELRILERILRKEGKESRHTFTGWKERHTILLTVNGAYQSLTAEKLAAVRKKETSLGVQAVVDDLKKATEIRTFRELLFPIRLKEEVFLPDGPEAFGKALADSGLLPLLLRCHREAAPFYFRMDLRGGFSLEERSRYVKRAAAAIEENSGRKLINAPEDYEFEIRLYFSRLKKIHVFLKMHTIPMERFSYRKETISASIHPSAAAELMELARPWMKERAQILDPCCGAGTMLAERHRLLPAREIYGIDTFGEAVEKARINTTEAGMQVNFIHKDYLDFTHAYPFDEIIANMPMRGKRTKEEQDSFYRGFFDKSEELLAPDGILILYTNENGFVKKQIRLHPAFKLCREFPIREKEQFYLYIIACRKTGKTG